MGTFGVKRASDEYFCPSTVINPRLTGANGFLNLICPLPLYALSLQNRRQCGPYIFMAIRGTRAHCESFFFEIMMWESPKWGNCPGAERLLTG